LNFKLMLIMAIVALNFIYVHAAAAVEPAGNNVLAEIKPGTFEFHMKTGLLKHSESSYDAAIAEYEKALKIKPGDIDATYNMGLSYQYKKDNSKALELYKKVINADPAHYASHLNAGIACDDMGDQAAAIDYLKKAANIAPARFEAYYNFSNIYLAQKSYAEAIEACKKGIAANPVHDRLINNLGYAYFHTGKLEEAIANAKTAVSINSKNEVAQFNLGTYYESAKDAKNAYECYTRALEIKPDYYDAILNAAIMDAENGRLKLAETKLLRAKLLNPKDARSYYNLGIICNMNGDGARALVEFQRAAELEPSYAAELAPVIEGLKRKR